MSYDLKTLTIAELISKLQAHELRGTVHNEEQVEGSFNAKFKYKKLVAEFDTQTTKGRGNMKKGV